MGMSLKFIITLWCCRFVSSRCNCTDSLLLRFLWPLGSSLPHSAPLIRLCWSSAYRTECNLIYSHFSLFIFLLFWKSPTARKSIIKHKKDEVSDGWMDDWMVGLMESNIEENWNENSSIQIKMVYQNITNWISVYRAAKDGGAGDGRGEWNRGRVKEKNENISITFYRIRIEYI